MLTKSLGISLRLVFEYFRIVVVVFLGDKMFHDLYKAHPLAYNKNTCLHYIFLLHYAYMHLKIDLQIYPTQIIYETSILSVSPTLPFQRSYSCLDIRA